MLYLSACGLKCVLSVSVCVACVTHATLSHSPHPGGVVSILALHGLFVLIKDFNLDYPDFFKKLYALFEPTVRLSMPQRAHTGI